MPCGVSRPVWMQHKLTGYACLKKIAEKLISTRAYPLTMDRSM
jgi:hypothetical protein